MSSIPLTKKQILEFLNEDLGQEGDVTTSFITPLQNKRCEFYFISKNKEDFILCGVEVLAKVLEAYSGSPFQIKILKKDGEVVKNGEMILKGDALARDFLAAERVSLNLIQHLSAISTKTAQMVAALNDGKIKILDTRKTIPTLRALQKYAVKCGGGENHRFGLYDAIMIKDNHISASGGIKNAILSVLKQNTKKLKVEVECETLQDVKEAILHKIDIIMLDNMNIATIKKAAKIVRDGKYNIKIEVSGGVNMKNIHKFKGLNIDFISSGALTHSVAAIDISAKIL